MIVVPAVDLLGGRAVRLVRGRREEATDYGDPLEAARRWAAAGATRLHVVDLDGAFGEGAAAANAAAIRRISAEAGVPVEVAGGLKSAAAVAAALDGGAAFAVVGTMAIERPDEAARAMAAHPGRVYVAVDAAGGRAVGRGWAGGAGATRDPLDLARWAAAAGARGVVFTAVERDGTLEGVDLDAVRRMLDAVACPVIASGGVASLADVEALAALRAPNLEGVIVGKALYEGRLDLAAAVRTAA